MDARAHLAPVFKLELSIMRSGAVDYACIVSASCETLSALRIRCTLGAHSSVMGLGGGSSAWAEALYE